jgi:phenylacetate-CoA ligase
LTETGPIACWAPDADAYRVLPNDIFVEALDSNGRHVADGERGEITVTGGRNPFLPLLRYRTGDWGRIERTSDSGGNAIVHLYDLEGRKPVLFRSRTGDIVNPVDLSRVLRDFPFVQHEFIQHADLSCELTVRVIARAVIDHQEVTDALRKLLGRDCPVTIRSDPQLGDRSAGGKAMPYRSELLLED